MYLFLLLSSLLFSALLTAFLIPKIILVSFRRRLFDDPDDRKVHTDVIPRLGGVAFTPTVIITVALLFGVSTLLGGPRVFRSELFPQLTLSLCALLLLYLEGLTDDLIGVGYRAKFGFQFLCAGMVAFSGVTLDNLYGLFGVHALPSFVGIPLSILLLVYIINAVNLIDGIDGLASGLSGIALFFLGCLFFYVGAYVYAAIAFATLGTLVPFFIYNVFGSAGHRRKIFMGDCGSQTVGLILGTLTIRFGMSSVGDVLFPDPLVVGVSLLLVPCLDVVRVMLGRIRKGRNPFMPDMTHIHHKFLSLGMSHRMAMTLILMLEIFFVLLNLGLLGSLDINIILVIDVLILCMIHAWINLMVRKRNRK